MQSPDTSEAFPLPLVEDAAGVAVAMFWTVLPPPLPTTAYTPTAAAATRMPLRNTAAILNRFIALLPSTWSYAWGNLLEVYGHVIPPTLEES
jgi:hypothetical protein